MVVAKKVLLFFLILHDALEVLSVISNLEELNGTVGGRVDFLWSTTHRTEIQYVKWGLYEPLSNEVSPSFIIASKLDPPGGKLSKELNTTAVRYRNRVQFIGNLSLGRAWFRLTNLEVNDTREYCANIREPVIGYVRYRVNLTVTEPMTTALPTAATTVTTAPGSYSNTTTSPAAPTPKPLSDGAIAGIVIGVIVVIGIGVVIVIFVVKKNKNGRGIL